MQILIGILAVAVAVPFFGQTQSTSSLDQVTAAYMAAFSAKDPATLASFYTEDGELMAPGASLYKGRDVIAAALEVTFRQSATLALMSSEAQTMGARAFDAGTFILTLASTDDSGQPEVLGGRYLTVFTRVGEEWKIAYHMFHAEDAIPQSEP